ncbi:MAG: hypothetical protein H7844_01530 [Nitrospirae bacterium YQR-1]
MERKYYLKEILLILIVAFYSLLLVNILKYHLTIIYHPYQLEQDELGMVLSTDLLLKGGNPYDFANQPMYINIYGIAYNYVVISVHKVISLMYSNNSATLILSHRMTSGIFIIFSVMLLIIVMRRLNFNYIYIYGAALIQYAAFMVNTTPIIRPDSFGTFMYLLSIIIPWRYNYTIFSILFSILFSLLGFYSKVYFIMGICVVLSYIFIYISKLRAMLYFLLFGLIFLISVLVMNTFYESYFYNVLLLQFNQLPYNFGVMIKQSWMFVLCNIALVAYLLIAMYYLFLKDYAEAVYNFFSGFSANINILDLREPLYRNKVSIFSYAAFTTLCALQLKLACNSGAWMSYYFQLFLPFFLVYVLGVKIKTFKSNFLLILLLTVTVYTNYSFGLFTNRTGSLQLPVASLTEDPTTRLKTKQSHDFWEDMSELIKKHNNVLVSKPFNFLVFNNGQRVYDSGFNNYYDKVITKNKLLKKIFPMEFSDLHKSFLNDIDSKISRKHFDLLILTHANDTGFRYLQPWFILNKTVFDNYAVVGSYRYTADDYILKGTIDFLILTPMR